MSDENSNGALTARELLLGVAPGNIGRLAEVRISWTSTPRPLLETMAPILPSLSIKKSIFSYTNYRLKGFTLDLSKSTKVNIKER